MNVDTWLGDSMMIYNALPSLDNRDMKKLVREDHVELSDITLLTKEAITKAFEKAMTRGHKLFGAHAFRKSVPPYRRTPINKSLFEAWGVLLSKLTDEEFGNLCRNKTQLLADYEKDLYSNNFVIAISRDSMSKWSVNHRYTVISSLINKYK